MTKNIPSHHTNHIYKRHESNFNVINLPLKLKRLHTLDSALGGLC